MEVFFYPNPVTANLTVQNGNLFACGLRIIDISGIIRWQGSIPSDANIQLDVAAWPAGNYFIESQGASKALIINR